MLRTLTACLAPAGHARRRRRVRAGGDARAPHTALRPLPAAPSGRMSIEYTRPLIACVYLTEYIGFPLHFKSLPPLLKLRVPCHPTVMCLDVRRLARPRGPARSRRWRSALAVPRRPAARNATPMPRSRAPVIQASTTGDGLHVPSPPRPAEAHRVHQDSLLACAWLIASR